MDHVFVINLKRRADRLQRFKEQARKAQLTRYKVVTAIDGHDPAVQEEHAAYMRQPLWHSEEFKWKRKLLGNACMYGCMTTFLQLTELVYAQQLPSVLFFEDDVVLCSSFTDKANSFVKQLPSDWKIALLGASDFHFHERTKSDKGPWYLACRGVYGAFAVMLNRSVLPELLALLKTKVLPPDVCFNVLFERHPFSCFVANPPLAIADLHDSDIHPFQHNRIQTRVGTDVSTEQTDDFQKYKQDYYSRTGWHLFCE